jgi:hypothetical protein
MIYLRQKIVFENCEIFITANENEKNFVIEINSQEAELSYEEFYQFVSILETIKPVKK